jgi:hypothetical protein
VAELGFTGWVFQNVCFTLAMRNHHCPDLVCSLTLEVHRFFKIIKKNKIKKLLVNQGTMLMTLIGVHTCSPSVGQQDGAWHDPVPFDRLGATLGGSGPYSGAGNFDTVP